MKKFAILADATCDLSDQFQKEYDVIVLPSHLMLPDKTEMRSYMNWDKISREAFYADLKKNPNGYSTSPANTQEFADKMEELVAEGRELMVMTISSAVSGAYSFATTAKKQVLAKYPEAKINLIDSMRFGPAFGLMLVYAARMREEGKSLDEVTQYLEENKNRFHQAGWLDDLSFVAKKGRLTNAKAFFGKLAGIKPIGEFDYNGLTTVIGKVKGAKAAYQVLLNYIEKTIENPEEQTIFIAQANRLSQAEQYREMLIQRFHPKEIYINDVFPACGINVGPGLMAAYYMGTPISKDLSVERKILEDAINGAQ